MHHVVGPDDGVEFIGDANRGQRFVNYVLPAARSDGQLPFSFFAMHDFDDAANRLELIETGEKQSLFFFRRKLSIAVDVLLVRATFR